MILQKINNIIAYRYGEVDKFSVSSSLHVNFETVTELTDLGILTRGNKNPLWVLKDSKYGSLFSPTTEFSAESLAMISSWEEVSNSIELLLINNFEIFIHLQIIRLSFSNPNLDSRLLVLISQPRSEDGTWPHHLTNHIEQIRSQILNLHPHLIGPDTIWMKYNSVNGIHKISSIVFNTDNEPDFKPYIDITYIAQQSKIFFDLYHPELYTIENIRYKNKTGGIKNFMFPFSHSEQEIHQKIIDYMNYLQDALFEAQKAGSRSGYTQDIENIAILSENSYAYYTNLLRKRFAEVSAFPANSTRLNLIGFPSYQFGLGTNNLPTEPLTDLIDKMYAKYSFMSSVYSKNPHGLVEKYRNLPSWFGKNQ